MNTTDSGITPPSTPDPAFNISEDAGRLTIEYRNSSPIELTDLTLSLTSVADEYRRFATSRGLAGSENARLYIQQIRTGSIIADLVAAAHTVVPPMLPLITDVNTIVQFGQYVQTAYDSLLGKEDAQDLELAKANLENLTRIVEPIAKDNAGQFNLIANSAVFNAPVYVSMGSVEANAAQNAAKRLIQELREPVTGIHRNVALYWHQARNTSADSAGDLGIIESISPSPVKVKFGNDSIKAKALWDGENPFLMVYIVDVAVETVGNRPVLYNVLMVHDKLPKPPQTQQGALVIDE